MPFPRWYPRNQNLIPEAYRIYRAHKNQRISNSFRKMFARPRFDIHFLGLFDTVTSVGWVYDPVRLDNTTTNPSVTTVRHAVAIDERRAFFRSNRWYAHRENPDQDIKQVWFAGVHSDVGGGYSKDESSLSNIALEWMLVESCEHQLEIDRDKVHKILDEAPPNPTVDAHNSLRWFWLPAEIWLKYKSFQLRNKRWIKVPWLNLAFRRKIYCSEVMHESVLTRSASRDDYPPKNLVKRLCKCDGQCDNIQFPVEPIQSIEEIK